MYVFHFTNVYVILFELQLYLDQRLLKMPILPSASASAPAKATPTPVFKTASCVDSYAECPSSNFRKLPSNLDSGFPAETELISNALQSQFRIKHQFKQNQEQKPQQYETNLENVAFPFIQECQDTSREAQGKTSRSQLIANDLMSISRSNLVNGSMVSIRSEQQLCQLYNSQHHSDYIISDYMDKIATRISLLETELKFAWRALDLLSNEYGKIWTRLEKLENISVEQQSVLSNLMGLITAAKQQQTDLEVDLNRELELDFDFNVKAPFDSFVEVDNLSDESQKLEVMGGHSHAFINDIFVDDDGLPLGPDERDANDELFLNINGKVQSTERMESWQGQETGFRKEALQKLYSDSDLLIYEQRQIMANNARAQLFQEFLNGQRVLEQVASASTLDPVNTTANTSNILNVIKMSDEVDDNVDKVPFFRLAATKIGQGGNEVVPIEDTGGTKPRKEFETEVTETFYKNLNEAYRQTNLTLEISNMERLLKQSESTTEHINTPVSLNLYAGNNGTSSLMMIYEGNEEDNFDVGQDIGKLTKTSEIALVATTTTNSGGTEYKETRKNLRKKKHRKNEMDMINNLKSILAQASNTNININTDNINKFKANQESNFFLCSERENRSSITSSSSEDSGNSNGENLAILDGMTEVMIKEINKISGLQSLSAPQILKLRQTIRMEQNFFEKLNQVDKNLTLLLLNPVTMTEELQRLRVLEIDEKFDLVIQKFEKNIDTLKKLVGNSFEDYKRNTIISYTPEFTTDPKTTSLKDNKYSEHLMRNNSDLDEQLKLLENQETEINRKENIEQINNIHKQEVNVNQSNIVDDSEPHSDKRSLLNGSSSSIYNQDEYIRSLKKSLERHNSMLFLLHLQNPEKHKASSGNLDEYLLGTTSPPPPAPNDNLFDTESTMTNSSTVKLKQQYQLQQRTDSGLSSTSGWSLDSPVVSENGTQNKYNNLTVGMKQMIIEADGNKHMFQHGTDVNSHVFSEENLNYIHELSKNIPICSAYENKSMFNVNSMKETNPKVYTVDEMLHWDENHERVNHLTGRLKSNCRVPDLLKNESQSRVIKSTLSGYQETNIDIDLDVDRRRKPNLTDRLVFYPSANGITDYNSSHNLVYLGFDNNMPSDSKQIVPDGRACLTNTHQKISVDKQMLGKPPKVWNKLSNFLPENLKLKRSMRYKNRSQSLPGNIVHAKGFQIQGRGQASSYPLVATNLETSKIIQKLPMRITRATRTISPPNSEQVPFSVAIRTHAKHKKRSFSLKMNHLMQKAKTYKRHSFGLRHVSSISEPEIDVSNFTSQNENDSPSENDNESDEMELENQLNVDHYVNSEDYCDEQQTIFPVVGNIKKTNAVLNADMPEIFLNSNEVVDHEVPHSAAKDENLVIPFYTMECSTVSPATLLITSEDKTPTSNGNSPKLNYWMNQQQSLEIPSSLASRDDDDNRSQYSGRTLSSSRRQSTEDSIDTDDEYFCYELRQLEELEKQTVTETQQETYVGPTLSEIECGEDVVLFTQIGQLAMNEKSQGHQLDFQLENIEQGEKEALFTQIGQLTMSDTILYDNVSQQPLDLHPDESVKQKMSRVLSELKCIVRVEPDIRTENRNDGIIDKEIDVKKVNLPQKCALVSDIHSAWQDVNFELQLPVNSNQEIQYLEDGENAQDWQDQIVSTSKILTEVRKDHTSHEEHNISSSSPSLSFTSDEEYDAINKQKKDQIDHLDVDSFHDLSSGVTSGPDSPAELSDDMEEEKSVNALNSEAAFKHNDYINAEVAHIKNELPTAILDPKEHSNNINESINNNILAQSCQFSDVGQHAINNSISMANANSGSSKWKLLKTLKERKIEEKNNQDKIKEEELAKDKKKVIW